MTNSAELSHFIKVGAKQDRASYLTSAISALGRGVMRFARESADRLVSRRNDGCTGRNASLIANLHGTR